MNKNRVNSIKKSFEGVGPDSTTLYTNQEIVDLLMAAIEEAAEGICSSCEELKEVSSEDKLLGRFEVVETNIPNHITERPWYRERKIKNTIGVTGLLVALGVGFVAGKNILSRK